MKKTSRRNVSRTPSGSATADINWFVTITLLAFAVLAVMGLSTAQAGDAKVYPGSMGVRWAGTNPPSFLYSAIGNPSATSWLYVDLPIINDSDNGISRGWVRAIDMNPSYDVTCSLNSMYRYGPDWYGWWTPTKSTAGSASYAQILEFGSLGGSGIAHYYYTVKIPPKYGANISYITSYRAEEK